jgi:hypothetical protein
LCAVLEPADHDDDQQDLAGHFGQISVRGGVVERAVSCEEEIVVQTGSQVR